MNICIFCDSFLKEIIETIKIFTGVKIGIEKQ